MAQAVRAVLLAMATVTSRVGLRPMSDLTQAPVRVSVVSARRVTEVAPTTSKRRRYPLPIFEMCPRRSLPPDEVCRGSAGRNAIRPRDGPHAEERRERSAGLEDRRIRPPTLARLRLLRRKARVLRDAIAGGTTDIRLGGGHLDGVVLSEFHEKPRLLIGCVAPRHKGGSPFQKTASVSDRPRSQTQICAPR